MSSLYKERIDEILLNEDYKQTLDNRRYSYYNSSTKRNEIFIFNDFNALNLYSYLLILNGPNSVDIIKHDLINNKQNDMSFGYDVFIKSLNNWSSK